jgi:chromosome segregation ATPase
MSSSVALYEALTSAPDDRTRARVIAEAFERLEERYPHLPELATEGHVRESELRLKKEIEQVRAELRESELRLKKEIEEVRAELRESELRLQKEIEQVRAELSSEIEQVRATLRETELRLQKEIEQVRADLGKAIEQVRADLSKQIEQVRAEIARAKVDMLKWIVPLMVGQVVVIAALVKLLSPAS